MDRVIGVWHHFAPRDGYTKFDKGVGSNPLDFFFGVGSSSARAVDFSIFSVVLCTPQEFLKRFGEYPHEIAVPRDSEMRGQYTTACTFFATQLENVAQRNVGSN